MVQCPCRALCALALCALAVYLLSRGYDPQRLSGRAVTRCVAGLTLLLVWNLLVPLRLGINPLSMLTAGCLGLPGMLLLAVLALMA
ncbi:MAG: pro-sigmaK processing inhibitor BofA family protein [Aristaeellaceae bacterium]